MCPVSLIPGDGAKGTHARHGLEMTWFETRLADHERAPHGSDILRHMPKKKKAARKPPRRQQSAPAHQQLTYGPARTLLGYPEDDTEMAKILGAWPYRICDAEGAGGFTSLNETAIESGTLLRETAESMVALEDAGHLTWDAARDQYLLTAPAEPEL